MKFEIYKARDGHRWRLRARNGRIIADGGEGYTRPSLCVAAVVRVVDGLRVGTDHGPGVTVESHAKLGIVALGKLKRSKGIGAIKLHKR